MKIIKQMYLQVLVFGKMQNKSLFLQSALDHLLYMRELSLNSILSSRGKSYAWDSGERRACKRGVACTLSSRGGG